MRASASLVAALAVSLAVASALPQPGLVPRDVFARRRRKPNYSVVPIEPEGDGDGSTLRVTIMTVSVPVPVSEPPKSTSSSVSVSSTTSSTTTTTTTVSHRVTAPPTTTPARLPPPPRVPSPALSSSSHETARAAVPSLQGAAEPPNTRLPAATPTAFRTILTISYNASSTASSSSRAYDDGLWHPSKYPSWNATQTQRHRYHQP